MTKRQTFEAFVWTNEDPLPFRYRPLPHESVIVSSHADSGHPDRTVYREGIDYIVDYEKGLIRRTKDSRIADWTRHPLYGIAGFNHNLFDDYSNRDYTAYAAYSYAGEEAERPPVSERSEGALERWLNKLRQGEQTLYVVYGDSISVGGEASSERFAYFHRFAERARDLYPRGEIKVVNRAIGGETSEGGLERIEADVVRLQPDLVTIGYGMNDQNKYETGNGVPLDDYERNMRSMIQAIRQGTSSDIVLVTPCEPNPLWQHTSGTIHEYADAIRRLGAECGLSVADAHALWVAELAAGKTPESLLLNNINHPNDYGHDIYYRAFAELLQSPGSA